MQLKTFEAPTLDQALRSVRDVFGDDALIVSTDENRRGQVRVTAARERVALAEAPLPTATNGKPVNDPVPILRCALVDSGVDDDLADVLLNAARTVPAPVAPAVALAAAVESCFRFRPLTSAKGVAPDAQRTLALVGPPGSGKTVTTAKLAARVQLDGGSVRLISIDIRKTGGAAHLESLAQHLTIGATIARTPAELAAAARGNTAGSTLIDTFGANPFDPTDIDELAAFLSAARAEPVLVLPAGVEARDTADMAATFDALGCRRAIVTRIDLTRRLGSVLSAFRANRIDFCDVSVSPDILPLESGGLRPLNPVALARLILPDPAPVTAGTPQRASNARVLAA